MQKSSLVGSLALSAALLTSPVLAQEKTIDITQTEMRARIGKICADPEIKGIMKNPEKVCEYSLDNGESWKAYTQGVASIASILLVLGLLKIRLKKSDDSKTRNKDTPDEEEKQTNQDTVDEYSGFDYLEEAELWLKGGRFDEAIDWLEKGIKANSEDIKLYMKLCEEYHKRMDHAKFDETYTRIIEHFGESISEDQRKLLENMKSSMIK